MPRGRRNPATFYDEISDTELLDGDSSFFADAPHALLWDVCMLVLMVSWILALEHGLRQRVSPFVARKLCHAGCGLGIMLMDSSQLRARLFIWAVAASSIAITWNLAPIPAFRFARPRDVGVTTYLLLVSVWFYMQLPAQILAPVFFADPAGAIVGKFASTYIPRYNPRWYQQKTLLGSTAVFLLTFATIAYECTLRKRVLVAVAAMLAEAVGGELDNLALACVVVFSWLASTHESNGAV
mmetsp:Transcript_30359/g.66581  ORF Transcript_30359/g.66581 Transcript_30359/m.66581 type:complete len:240 (-) Transcript_30359:54-773(-)